MTVDVAQRELMDRPVSTAQLDSIRGLSRVVLGDPVLVFQVCGKPATRGDASVLLQAIHCVRTGQVTSPGVMSEHAEKIRSAMNDTTPAVQPGKPLETTLKSLEQTSATKHCAGCDQTKPVTEFNKNRTTRDGLQTYCKPCAAAAGRASRKAKPKRDKPADNTNRQKPSRTSSRQAKPVDTPTADPDPPAGYLTVVYAGPSPGTGIDPTLSQLRAVRDALTAKFNDAENLEDAADIIEAVLTAMRSD